MKLALVSLALVGCTDEGGGASPYACMAGGGGGCFEMPTDPVAAAAPDGTLEEPFLACAPFEVVDSPGAQTFTGATTYMRSGERAKDVHVELFGDAELTTLLGETMSDESGAFELATAGAPNLVFARASKDGYLPHAHLYQRVDLANPTLALETATRMEIDDNLHAVGDQFLPGRSQLSSIAVDCANRPLANVIANISPVSGRNGSHLFVPETRVYYATEGGEPMFQRRTQQMQTTASGQLAISEIPPGHYFVQLWGFTSADDVLIGSLALKLLDEVEITTSTTETKYIVPLHARL